jgi:tetratricopeptide (TPR) repeat protein
MTLLNLFLSRVVYMQGSVHRAFGNRTGFRREHENAVKCFTRAYNLDPYLRAALLDRAILFWREMDRVPEALADLDALLEEDPEYAPARLNRGMALHEIGRYEEALADLEAYLEDPDIEPAYREPAERMATAMRELLAGGAASDEGRSL